MDRLYATGERGWFKLEPSFNALGVRGKTSEGPINIQAPEYQQVAQMDAFAQSIRQQERPLASGEEGRKDLQLIASILQAVETGRKLTISY